jgi:hypothetical protein
VQHVILFRSADISSTLNLSEEGVVWSVCVLLFEMCSVSYDKIDKFVSQTDTKTIIMMTLLIMTILITLIMDEMTYKWLYIKLALLITDFAYK